MQQLRVQIQAELASRSLYEFVKQAWHVLEPDNPFVDGWHIGCICEHLEAATAGQLRRLIINIAPRHCKSLLTSVFWPAWEWTRNPAVRWLYTSYGDELAVRDSIKTRQVVKSLWYQSNWGQKVQIIDDQDTKHKFQTTQQGYRMATSVTGGITGEGGDRLVLDDPHNALQANSELERAKVIDFVDRAWSSRVNNPKTVVKVVIMQRLHVEDVTAHLMKKEAGWEHLVLPTKYVPTTRVFFNGKKDPRETEEQLLWPQRFGPAEVKDATLDLGVNGFQSQHQQDPRAASGGMFDTTIMRTHEVKGRPGYAMRGRFWDLASSTKKDSKRTSGALISKTPDGHYYIEHMKVGKWRPDERNAVMRNIAKSERVRKIGIEHEGGSSGEDQEVAMLKLLAGYPVESIPVSGDKAVRADSFAAHCNQGLVHIVNDGTWDIELLYAELLAFPTGEYKDQVDSLSLGFNWLARKTVIMEAEEGPKRAEPHWTDSLPGEQDWRDNVPTLGGDTL